MAIYIGNKNLKNAYIGSTPIKKIYQGSQLIWSNNHMVTFKHSYSGHNPITTNTAINIACYDENGKLLSSGEDFIAGHESTITVHISYSGDIDAMNVDGQSIDANGTVLVYKITDDTQINVYTDYTYTHYYLSIYQEGPDGEIDDYGWKIEIRNIEGELINTTQNLNYSILKNYSVKVIPYVVSKYDKYEISHNGEVIPSGQLNIGAMTKDEVCLISFSGPQILTLTADIRGEYVYDIVVTVITQGDVMEYTLVDNRTIEVREGSTVEVNVGTVVEGGEYSISQDYWEPFDENATVVVETWENAYYTLTVNLGEGVNFIKVTMNHVEYGKTTEILSNDDSILIRKGSTVLIDVESVEEGYAYIISQNYWTSFNSNATVTVETQYVGETTYHNVNFEVYEILNGLGDEVSLDDLIVFLYGTDDYLIGECNGTQTVELETGTHIEKIGIEFKKDSSHVCEYIGCIQEIPFTVTEDITLQFIFEKIN